MLSFQSAQQAMTQGQVPRIGCSLCTGRGQAWWVRVPIPEVLLLGGLVLLPLLCAEFPYGHVSLPAHFCLWNRHKRIPGLVQLCSNACSPLSAIAYKSGLKLAVDAPHVLWYVKSAFSSAHLQRRTYEGALTL